jgi:hypothetical protein
MDTSGERYDHFFLDFDRAQRRFWLADMYFAAEVFSTTTLAGHMGTVERAVRSRQANRGVEALEDRLSNLRPDLFRCNTSLRMVLLVQPPIANQGYTVGFASREAKRVQHLILLE